MGTCLSCLGFGKNDEDEVRRQTTYTNLNPVGSRSALTSVFHSTTVYAFSTTISEVTATDMGHGMQGMSCRKTS